MKEVSEQIFNKFIRTMSVNLRILDHINSMLLRLAVITLALSSTLVAFSGSIQVSDAVAENLSQLPSYKKGEQALLTSLPEIAADEFQIALDTLKKSPAKTTHESTVAYLSVKLAEALIKTSLTTKGQTSHLEAEAALRILKETPSISSYANAPLWKAEALIALGRYQDAANILQNVTESQPEYETAALARAKILLGLSQLEDALLLLNPITKSANLTTSNTANLLIAEIHIQQQNFPSAGKSLENITTPSIHNAKSTEYLKARLKLAEEDYETAIQYFETLISNPQPLPLALYHACYLGIADSQIASDKKEDAIKTLESFIDKHPDSPELSAAFSRLYKLHPANISQQDPSIIKLIEWSASTVPPPSTLYISGDSSDSIPLKEARQENPQNLYTLSLYYRAQLLADSDEKSNWETANALYNQLRAYNFKRNEAPSQLYLELHSLSLLETAYIQLKQDQPELAASTLSVLDSIAYSSELRDRANLIKGLLLATEKKYDQALNSFLAARQSQQIRFAKAANINASLVALKMGDIDTFEEIYSQQKDQSIRATLKLEKALLLCEQKNTEGRYALEDFIIQNPDHPRSNTARLALAEASVELPPFDPQLAKAQIEYVSPLLSDSDNQYKIAQILIQAEELSQNWEGVTTAAEKFTVAFPEDPRRPNIMLKLGEAYYYNADYNKARRVFQEISANTPDSPAAEYADFYSAMSARLGSTAQAREECITLFQKVIDKKNHLSSEARIQQSRVLIDLRKYKDAEACLAPLLTNKQNHNFIKNDAQILMADCLQRQGGGQPKKYQQAIDIYNSLLTQKELTVGKKNQLLYLKGKTYENMNLRKEALSTYYSVISDAYNPSKNTAQGEEWRWFYQCSFQALFMLESDSRWEAAVKLARKIAQYNGPRSEEAHKRANNIAKTNMIWEDVDPLSKSDTPLTETPNSQ